MINIDGVGSYKLKHYCPAFLETIQNYKAKSIVKAPSKHSLFYWVFLIQSKITLFLNWRLPIIHYFVKKFKDKSFKFENCNKRG